jgi:hypothetical protein
VLDDDLAAELDAELLGFEMLPEHCLGGRGIAAVVARALAECESAMR